MANKNDIKSVFAILLSEDGRSFLLVKRRDVSVWVFPGGGIEEGETREAACLRELEEETGLSCQIVKKVGDYNHDWIIPVKASVFLCRRVSGTPKITAETRDIAFFPIDAPPRHLLSVFKEFLDYALDKSPNPAPKLRSVNFGSALKFLFYNPLFLFRTLTNRCRLLLSHN